MDKSNNQLSHGPVNNHQIWQHLFRSQPNANNDQIVEELRERR